MLEVFFIFQLSYQKKLSNLRTRVFIWKKKKIFNISANAGIFEILIISSHKDSPSQWIYQNVDFSVSTNHIIYQWNVFICRPWKWVLVAQLHPTVCHPMDCSLPGSSFLGISQARKWEEVAIIAALIYKSKMSKIVFIKTF